MSRHATGRGALSYMINRMPPRYQKTVLLPCYIAEGVIRAFALAGYEIKFYRLNENLTPSVSDVDRLLMMVEGAAILVIIHYFGFPVNSNELSEVIAEYEPALVSDCAHALFNSSNNEGEYSSDGDVLLYSLNKFLPLTDGAIIISKREDIDLSTDEKYCEELPQEVLASYQLHLENARDLFNSNDKSESERLLILLEENYEKYYKYINSNLGRYRQSSSSSMLERSIGYNELISRRLQNSSIVYDELGSSVFKFVRPIIEPGSVPFCIPVRVPASSRNKIVNRLFQSNILLSTLQDKWSFIPKGYDKIFQTESDFLNEHLLIPISEFIATDEMYRMVNELNSI